MDAIDKELEALTAPTEETVLVVIAVHNGVTLGPEDRPMLIPYQYELPVSVLLDIQRRADPFSIG